MKKGFTLIELLIVVAIIAILAAIAVPNFLEAQTRAKVSRSKADMRTVVTALESYKIDTNAYPSDSGNKIPIGSDFMTRAYANYGVAHPRANYTVGYELTTPISYLSSVAAIVDPFRLARREAYAKIAAYSGREMLAYTNNEMRVKMATGATKTAIADKMARDGAYCLAAAGPDGWVNNNYNATPDANGWKDHRAAGGGAGFPVGRNYDATNGTVSIGDIVRSPKFTDTGWENPATNI